MTQIYPHYDLSHHNTMALSCVANVAIIISSPDDIRHAIDTAHQRQLPLFVLSGGSNVLLPSSLHACVLLPKITGISILQDDDTHITISVGNGENWHDFIGYCLTQGWYGLENLALIPGLVGASPIQNIGAYGVQVSDFIDHVIAYDLQTGERVRFDNDDCQFEYRHSIFKQNPNRHLITEVVFRLHKDPTKVLTNYGDLAQVATQHAQAHARHTPTPQDVFDAVVEIRQSKLPDPAVLANCGSFFQNPIITQAYYQTLKQNHPSLPHYPVNDTHVKVPAGWLIDQAGLKGKGVAPILTHAKQALVLTNHAPHTATQDDIKTAQTLIVQTVQEQFGITLVREPVWVSQEGDIV